MEIARRESAAQDLARCRAEHGAKRAREMRRIGESRRVSGVCDGLAARERPPHIAGAAKGHMVAGGRRRPISDACVLPVNFRGMRAASEGAAIDPAYVSFAEGGP
jgi:sirohydrochlorin ferrochelatase